MSFLSAESTTRMLMITAAVKMILFDVSAVINVSIDEACTGVLAREGFEPSTPRV